MKELYARYNEQKNCIDVTAYEVGYIEGVMTSDGEEQDAYILGIDIPVEAFWGKIIAIVHRNDDVEEKWVVFPEDMDCSEEEIRKLIHFQEQYFDSHIIMR